MAALAHHDKAGLDRVGLVDDLLRRMAQDNVGFKFYVLLLGAFTQRDKALLVALLPVFKYSVELRALGGFGRPDYRDDEQLGLHVTGHRKCDIQRVLCMWRRVECNQYPLNSDKHRASHLLHLPFLCGYWPHNLLLCFLARMGKKMAGKKERVRNHGGYYCAGDYSAHNVGVLRLRDDLMIEAEQC